jgi:outer membrane biosynthesis protein TonB
MTIEEEDYRKYGLLVTLLFHAGLLALFFFVILREPQPPLSGGDGIVLNYGLDAEGYGDVQTTAPANDSKNIEDSRPAPARPVVTAQPEVKPEPAKPTPVVEEKLITTDEESPVNVKVVETPPKVVKPQKEEVKVVEKPQPKVVEQPREEVKVVEKPKALYPGKSTTADGTGNGTAGTSNNATGNNNGDRPGKVGDQGDPNGSLNSKALYGKPGTGSGGSGEGSLNMPGWGYDRKPRPNDTSSETGELVFRIKINEEGEVESVVKVSGNVSPALEKLYRDEVYRSTFTRTSSGTAANVGATGTIRFIIRSK